VDLSFSTRNSTAREATCVYSLSPRFPSGPEWLYSAFHLSMPSFQIPSNNNVFLPVSSSPALPLPASLNPNAPPQDESLSILPGREGNPTFIEAHATDSAGQTVLESISDMIVDNQLVINTFIAGKSPLGDRMYAVTWRFTNWSAQLPVVSG
jgi:hypothetical protein